MPGKATRPRGTHGLRTTEGDFSPFGQSSCFPPFHPPALPLRALTRACCTLVSLSLCRHRRFSSRSRKGSTSPTLRLSPVSLALWARTSRIGSAVCEGERWERWVCFAFALRADRQQPARTPTPMLIYFSTTPRKTQQRFCNQIKLNFSTFCLSPPYFFPLCTLTWHPWE